MGISRIIIKNYKALKTVRYNLNRDEYQIQCLLGKNGSGKSSLLDAIEYFYSHLINTDSPIYDIIDTKNHYIQQMEIEMEFDFSELIINNSNPYFDEKLSGLDNFIVNNKMKLKLTQYKNKTIKWFPKGIDSQQRKIIGKLFPIYVVDTRFISLQNWSQLWDIISDISISKVKIKNDIFEEKLDAMLEEVYGDKYNKTIKFIKQVFDSEEVKTGNMDYRDKYKNALIMRMGGEEFLNKENNLNFYSDGLNSLKYIKLVFEIVAELSKTGWKNPLLLIDEPEIGLHPQYIDELVSCFGRNINKRISVIIATHSAHFISDMIKNEISVGINRVYLNRDYANIERIKDIIDEKQRYMINDNEIESYFASAILFVEGKSEIQFYKNKHIIGLFPEIGKIKVYNYDSDNSILKLIYPDVMNFSIPYITIVDMDKIINYSYITKKFKLKRDELVNPLYSNRVITKQKYLFYNNGDKKRSTYNQRIRIEKMLKKATYVQTTTHFWLDEPFYDFVKYNIKEYCAQYNVVPMNTTIEGAIVNVNNIEIVLEWLKIKLAANEVKILDRLLARESLANKKYRTTIARLILNGKLDTLKNYNEKDVNIDSAVSNAISKLKTKIGSKTGGWIGEFLDYYFNNAIMSLSTVEKRREKFLIDFNEISYVLQNMIKMVKYNIDE